MVYVGVEEKGASRTAVRFRKAPKGAVKLPDEMTEAGQEFMTRLFEAIQHNDAAEDDSHGYSLTHYPPSRAVQEKFLAFASTPKNVALLRDVLRHASDGEQRALAAQILAYASEKQAVVPDLENAISDPYEGVRNNAVRALGVMAIYAQNSPESSLQIPFEPMVRLLNSPIWTDRNKSLMVLSVLSIKRDPALLKSLKKAALPALAEMARWHNPGYAVEPFMMLGRIGGLSEETIMEAWQKRDVPKVLDAANAAGFD